MAGRYKKNRGEPDEMQDTVGGVVQTADRDVIMRDKYPYFNTLMNAVQDVLRAVDTSEDAGISAMRTLLSALPSGIRVQFSDELDEFREYIRDQVHLSPRIIGYQIAYDNHLYSIEDGERCYYADCAVRAGTVRYSDRKVRDDADLWRRMHPVKISAASWRGRLQVKVQDTLGAVIDALEDKDMLWKVRNEPTGGEV
jgi:hypothetical protein